MKSLIYNTLFLEKKELILKIRMDIMKKYIVVGNKMKTNNPFSDLESTLIAEMRNDVKTDYFDK